jgi:hypothetical protein
VQATAQLTGKEELPWEGRRRRDSEQHFKACMSCFQDPIFLLLHRNPNMRPSMSSFACMCRRLLATHGGSRHLIDIQETTQHSEADVEATACPSDSNSLLSELGGGISSYLLHNDAAHAKHTAQQHIAEAECRKVNNLVSQSSTIAAESASFQGVQSGNELIVSNIAVGVQCASSAMDSRAHGPTGQSTVMSVAGTSRSLAGCFPAMKRTEQSSVELDNFNSNSNLNLNSNANANVAACDTTTDSKNLSEVTRRVCVQSSNLMSLNDQMGGMGTSNSIVDSEVSGKLGSARLPDLRNPVGENYSRMSSCDSLSVNILPGSDGIHVMKTVAEGGSLCRASAYGSGKTVLEPSSFDFAGCRNGRRRGVTGNDANAFGASGVTVRSLGASIGPCISVARGGTCAGLDEYTHESAKQTSAGSSHLQSLNYDSSAMSSIS